MLSFLTLPRELRDEILSLVVTSRIVAPVNGTRYRATEFQLQAPLHLPDLPDAYRPACLSLLLTNRQLHAETLLVVKREHAVVELDVAYVDMDQLWPTYRVIPPRSAGPTFQKVIVNINLTASDESASIHPDMYNLLWHFIDRFLLYGPVSPLKPRIIPNIFVKELQINFELRSSNSECSIEEVPHRTVQYWRHRTHYQWLYGVDEVDAARCVDLFVENLDLNHEICPFSMPYLAELLQKIGRISVFVGRQLRHGVNFEQLAPNVFASEVVGRDAWLGLISSG